MVLGWTESLLFGGGLVEGALESLCVGGVATKRADIGVSVVEVAILCSESAISHMDVGVSTGSIDVVVNLLARAAATDSHAWNMGWELSAFLGLRRLIHPSVTTIVEANVGISSSTIRVVDASLSSCCQYTHDFVNFGFSCTHLI